ncbi:MAG: hypothetical protein H5U07_03615, partial [Candidatus Aminicenantes bacterium]|nr:hypothetical protein [Candidatus Aminicenantes bacterium]
MPSERFPGHFIRFLVLLFFLVLIVLNTFPGLPEALGRPAFIQTEEIFRLTREAEELEGRAARLRAAVENCRRSISPQSPNCFIEISWLKTRVSWKEAERIAQGMEEKARDLRRRIEILKARARASQAATPPPPVTQKPQNTTSPPPVSNAPSSQQKPAPNAPAQTVKPPAPQAPAQTAAPSTPAAPRRIAGLTESEWKDYNFLQQEVEELYSRVPLDNEESIRFFEALKARNALWEKAVSRSGLRAEERKKLRLPI